MSALAVPVTPFQAWQSSEIVAINELLAYYYSGYVSVSACTLSGLCNLEKRLFSIKNLIEEEVSYLGI